MSESDSRVTFRNPGEADEPQLLELLTRVFRRWPRFEIPVSAREHLRWKMRSNPMVARHQWVAEIDGRIVAMILRIFRRIRIGGRDYLARDGVDVAVDPRHQSRGIYGAMLDYAREMPQDAEFDLGLAYSSNPRTRRAKRKAERRELDNPIQVLEKPCLPLAIAARRRKRGGRLPAPLSALRITLQAAWNRLGNLPHWRPIRRSWSITTLERFDGRTDRLFDEAARPFDFLVVRSSDYMNWRYRDPAAAHFTVRIAEQEGRILGYLILKISQGEGYIADLLALPERVDVVRSLIRDALRIFREARVELVQCWMISRHPYNRILRRYGFLDSGKDVGFRYRLKRIDPASVEFLEGADARIHLTQGDTDWI
jgi:GNAT superfamily N-acetyltransferase